MMAGYSTGREGRWRRDAGREKAAEEEVSVVLNSS